MTKGKTKKVDRVKLILDELGIKPLESWYTIHYSKGNPDKCYYHMFKLNNKCYCASGDSSSLIFSDEEDNYFYQGYSDKVLKDAIKGVMKKYE